MFSFNVTEIYNLSIFFYLFQSSAIFSFLGFPGPPHLMEFVSMTFNLYFRISTSPWSQFYFLMVCSLFRFNTTVTCSSLLFSSHFPSTFYPPLKHTASTTIHQTLLSYRFLLLSAYHKNSPLTICRFNKFRCHPHNEKFAAMGLQHSVFP